MGVTSPERARVVGPDGCPVSRRGGAFDPFVGAYQDDPAEALRWSREEEPVFFSPVTGYWVISRYDDIKAVFRDPITFSPAIALEKITPPPPEAQEVLARYGYAMNRTLVNEDEPQHTERRRALMASFEPAALAGHEAMVRRLTEERVDSIVDAGRADLVDGMLWEVPLTVALHFLGVPEDDMDMLRRFSVAHTVNTWGRPTPEEQVAVAEAVGKFWTYAGGVLERMRADPDRPGWMPYAIRRQRELPEVVTDSYLHSMMMAIIVAAHETTAHASANMFRRLLEDRTLWQAVCADPGLIPNTVEECLRHSGSVVAWRRITTRPARVGGVDVPEGAKLLIVTASANHDPRHFDDPDVVDPWRQNPTDHLTFGYGAHQCMGKNLARMEMRIFLEELSRRLPHMELEPQEFTFVPNTSFRGPEHVWVRWDPAWNPERADPAVREPRARFEIGAPRSRDLARTLDVVGLEVVAEGVVRVTLTDPTGRDLPRWSAGAHVDLVFEGFSNSYSLCGDPEDRRRLEVAILREDGGAGGSVWLHDHLRVGDAVRARGPKNHFRLAEDAAEYVLIAGGIGITPMVAMADRLKALGRGYALHYCGRSRRRMAFLDRLERDHDAALALHVSEEGGRIDLAAVVAAPREGRQVYACGPEGMLDSLADLTDGWPAGLVHVERFQAGGNGAGTGAPFRVALADSGFALDVAGDATLLETLRRAGIDIASDCEEGLCGTCEVPVLDGDVDHRDNVLSRGEREAGGRMMACCSRGRGTIKLAL